MKCPNCGKEIANDSLFCEFCGTKTSKQVDRYIHVRWLYFVSSLLITWASVVLLILYEEVHWISTEHDAGYWLLNEMSEIYYTIGLMTLSALVVVSLIQAIKKKVRWNDFICISLLFIVNTLCWRELDLVSYYDAYAILSFLSIAIAIYYLIFNYVAYRKRNKSLK